MAPNRSVVLAGVKHSGKSVIGRALAARLNAVFVDTDDELLKRCVPPASSVREIYRRLGETEFRRFEAKVINFLADLPEKSPRVTALGGGVIGNPFIADERLKKLGVLVALDVPDHVAYDRVAAEGLPPFLISTADPEAEFCRRNTEKRRKFAAVADVIFAPDSHLSPEANAERLDEKLRKMPFGTA